MTSPSPDKPSARERSQACRAHLSALVPVLGLPFGLAAWRRPEAFVAHHGRQSVYFAAALGLLLTIHAALHALVHGVLWLHDWSVRELAGPSQDWAVDALEVLRPINGFALGLELLFGLGLALWHARRAAAGEWSEYFFVKTWDETKEAERRHVRAFADSAEGPEAKGPRAD